MTKKTKHKTAEHVAEMLFSESEIEEMKSKGATVTSEFYELVADKLSTALNTSPQYNANGTVNKHGTLREIVDKGEQQWTPDMVSTGGTVTKKGLEAVEKIVQKESMRRL